MGELVLYDRVDKGDKRTYRHVQEISGILRDNKEDRDHSDENWQKSALMKRVGCVPMAVWLLWESMGITDDPAELLKALERNPEYKTTEKKLI